MTKQEQSTLKELDGLVQLPVVQAQIETVVQRLRAELARQPDALMTWEPLSLEIFGEPLPAEIESAWVFVLRANSDTGAERHPNSHQRMMTFAGTGEMKIDVKETQNEVEDESEILWHSHVLTSDRHAPIEARWISIPKNIWHRPTIPAGGDWAVVSFHTVPAAELIEERPGAKQMIYETERKRRD